MPYYVSFFVKLKQEQLDDPATGELHQDLAVAIHWEPDALGWQLLPTALPPHLDAADAEGGEEPRRGDHR